MKEKTVKTIEYLYIFITFISIAIFCILKNLKLINILIGQFIFALSINSLSK